MSSVRLLGSSQVKFFCEAQVGFCCCRPGWLLNTPVNCKIGAVVFEFPDMF